MALIDCPECAVQVSDVAPSCPYCGFPVDKNNSKVYMDTSVISCETTANGLWYRATYLREFGEIQEAFFVYLDIITSYPNHRQAGWAENILKKHNVSISELQEKSTAQEYLLRAKAYHVSKPQIAYVIYKDIIRKYQRTTEEDVAREQIKILDSKYKFSDKLSGSKQEDVIIKNASTFAIVSGCILGFVVGFFFAINFVNDAKNSSYIASSSGDGFSYKSWLFFVLIPMFVVQFIVSKRSNAFKHKVLCGVSYLISLLVSFFIFAFFIL